MSHEKNVSDSQGTKNLRSTSTGGLIEDFKASKSNALTRRDISTNTESDKDKPQIITTPSLTLSFRHQKATENPLPGKEMVDKVPLAGKGAALLGMDTTLLIVCSNRPQYLKKSLEYIVKYHPKSSIPIVISEDGNNPEVARVIDDARKLFEDLAQGEGKAAAPFSHLHHASPSNKFYENGYFKLADHFKAALDDVFLKDSQAKRVIIVEEDLQISPDFFEFFAGTMKLLDEDPNLLAVSAWNDNGFKRFVKDNKQLYRSDFFPGLGWMLTKSMWQELSVKWPQAYWDDWLREPKQRKGRHIIRPEVSRTFHFGAHGVSNAQYSGYLTSVYLNEEFVPFTSMDLSYLTQDRWDASYAHDAKMAKLVTMQNYQSMVETLGLKEVRIVYEGFDEPKGPHPTFSQLALWSGIMDNVKAGVPRTAYHGIVSFWRGDVKVHFTLPDF